jgi:tetrahydrodipicolinate N-succinyltransferase
MAIMAGSKVRLYVRSVRTVTGTRKVERETLLRRVRSVETEPTHGYILPEDQQKAAEMVRRIARKYGLEVEMVDLAKENVLRRVLQKEKEGIRILPTLMARSGVRLEGSLTEMQVESVFSRLAEAEFQREFSTFTSR